MAVIHAQGEPFPPFLPQLNVFDIPHWTIFNEVFLWNLYISFSWSCLLPSTFRIPLDLTKPHCFLATDTFMAYICSHPQILRLPHRYEFPSCSSHLCSRSFASQRARAQWIRSQCTTVCQALKWELGTVHVPWHIMYASALMIRTNGCSSVVGLAAFVWSCCTELRYETDIADGCNLSLPIFL